MTRKKSGFISVSSVAVTSGRNNSGSNSNNEIKFIIVDNFN